MSNKGWGLPSDKEWGLPSDKEQRLPSNTGWRLPRSRAPRKRAEYSLWPWSGTEGCKHGKLCGAAPLTSGCVSSGALTTAPRPKLFMRPGRRAPLPPLGIVPCGWSDPQHANGHGVRQSTQATPRRRHGVCVSDACTVCVHAWDACQARPWNGMGWGVGQVPQRTAAHKRTVPSE
eukprot:360908-Chlamydomonas_euryale.AAC.22